MSQRSFSCSLSDYSIKYGNILKNYYYRYIIFFFSWDLKVWNGRLQSKIPKTMIISLKKYFKIIYLRLYLIKKRLHKKIIDFQSNVGIFNTYKIMFLVFEQVFSLNNGESRTHIWLGEVNEGQWLPTEPKTEHHTYLLKDGARKHNRC